MPESFNSASVHHAKNREDAMVMLESHVPLTHRERKLILDSLYDLAFREGARQGRQAGIESVHSQIRSLASARPEFAAILEGLLPPDEPREYTDPTTAIRESLAEKARQRTQASFTLSDS